MTEYAGAQRGITPYAGLAQRAGKPLAHIVQLATENRLGELFDLRIDRWPAQFTSLWRVRVKR